MLHFVLTKWAILQAITANVANTKLGLRSKRQRGRHKQTVYRSFHVHSAVTCTAALATGTNRALFSTSKVCQDALFIKHKYAQDDYN